MGLAASQARHLLLVARKSDLEYRGQMINQRRMLIAWDTEKVAKEYTDAMSNRVMKVKNAEGNLTSISIENVISKGYCVLDSSNKVIQINQLPKKSDETDDSRAVEDGLRTGRFHLAQYNSDTKVVGDKVDWRTNTDFNDSLDTTDDEAAKAKYEYESLKLQTQDKALEIELKNVDTQHNAVQTEIDAVKKVIDKNVESSFKTFG